MSTTTTNFGLIKPELTDAADITATNQNWDTLDRVIKENKDEAKNYTDEKFGNIPAPDVSGQINAHNTSSEAHSDIRTAVNEAQQSASKALTDAKSYTDTKIAAIPTPDVSVQIGAHNTNTSAHADIRKIANDHIANKSNPHGVTAAQVGADPSGTASSAVATHNSSSSAHSDIRTAVTNAQNLANGAKNSVSELEIYKLHWWKRRTAEEDFIMATSPVNGFFMGYNKTNTVSYSTEISVDASGNVSLKNPSTVNVTCNSGGLTAIQNNLLGKYVTGLRQSQSTQSTIAGVYFVPSDASIKETSNNYYGAYTSVYKVTYGTVYGETWGTVNSSNRNAYPDSGVSGGYEYEYLGVPFDNSVTAPKIATGSYKGTGTYGESNPCSLTFDFSPKAVFITGFYEYPDRTNYRVFGMLFSSGLGLCQGTWVYHDGNVSTLYPNFVTVEGNTISWYTAVTGDVKSVAQANDSRGTYFYTAIG